MNNVLAKDTSRDGGFTAWTKYFNTITSTSAGVGFDTLMRTIFKTVTVKSTISMIFACIVAEEINDRRDWWTESMYLLATKKIHGYIH